MRVISRRPFGSGIGSSNSRDQPPSMARGIVIICKAARQPWWGILIARITSGARHPGTAALARVLASPRPVRMVFANPTAVFAKGALHSGAASASASKSRCGWSGFPAMALCWRLQFTYQPPDRI